MIEMNTYGPTRERLTMNKAERFDQDNKFWYIISGTWPEPSDLMSYMVAAESGASEPFTSDAQTLPYRPESNAQGSEDQDLDDWAQAHGQWSEDTFDPDN